MVMTLLQLRADLEKNVSVKSAAVLGSSCLWIQTNQVQVTAEWEGIKGGFTVGFHLRAVTMTN